jgi:polysaccharide deacetylase family protein (PEP-CTERM system associated)
MDARHRNSKSLPVTVSAEKLAQRHVLSIDLEDYFQVEAFSEIISRDAWDTFPSRVVGNCHRLLDIFDRYEVKATFFVLGWVARRFPALVREVHERGHELACHSYWHRRIYTLTPEEFRADTRHAREAIQQAASVAVSGYRAPTWSVTSASLWALDILAEEGFTYDSSIFPIHHDLYGVPGASPCPWTYTTRNGDKLLEIPPATVRALGMNLPAAGGGYFRILPLRFTEWAFRQFENDGRSLVFYLHPWEIDPDQPRICGPFKSRFRHYTNLARTQERLARLLGRHSFQTFKEYIRELTPESAPFISAASRMAGTGCGLI